MELVDCTVTVDTLFLSTICFLVHFYQKCCVCIVKHGVSQIHMALFATAAPTQPTVTEAVDDGTPTVAVAVPAVIITVSIIIIVIMVVYFVIRRRRRHR